MFPQKQVAIFVILFCCGLLPEGVEPTTDSFDDILKDSRQLLLLKKAVEELANDATKSIRETGQDDNDVAMEEEDLNTSFDIYQFMRAVITEKEIKLNRKFLVYLVDLPISKNIHVHLAQLASVLNTLGDIYRHKKKHRVQEKVLEVLKSSRSIDEVKSQVEMIFQQLTLVEEKGTQTPKKPEQEIQYGETTKTILSFLNLLNAKPHQMMKIIISIISTYDSMSKETLQVVEMGLKMFPKTPYFSLVVDGVRSLTLFIVSSPTGHQLLELTPTLSEARNLSQMLDMISKETDLDIVSISKQLNDPKVREQLLESTAKFLTSSITLFQALLGDKAKILMLNTILMTQGMPSINPRKMIASGLRFIEKTLRTFTSWDVDFRKNEKMIIEHLKLFEKDVTWEQFRTVDKSRKVELISDFLVESFGEPVELLWKTQHHIFEHSDGPKCSQYLMCHINSRMVESSKSDFIKASTKGASMFGAWTWGLNGRIDSVAVYESILNGQKSNDCNVLYKEGTPSTCNIFAWLNDTKIEQTNIHTEL